MKHFLTIIGARPQFIKAASLSRVFREHYAGKVRESILHTGQHYDENMSQVFFEEMNIPRPDLELKLKSEDTFSEMLHGISNYISQNEFDAVILYGDTNSTLAGALAAVRKLIPVIHIESGLRSYNRNMPEEMNRVLTDHSSSMLFCPTDSAVENLKKEGIGNSSEKVSLDHPLVVKTGDIMYDSALRFIEIIEQSMEKYTNKLHTESPYILATIHRDFNTDNPSKLLDIFKAFDEITRSEKKSIIIPIHPRTAKMIETDETESVLKLIENNSYIKLIDPVSYTEMLYLENHADFIFTDSGGVQKEAYFFEKKCIVLRPQTEWVEIIDQGCAVLAHESSYEIVEKYRWFIKRQDLKFPPIFGNGKTAEDIALKILNHLK